MRHGFAYLAAIMDWHSRYVLAWRLSITLEADFCVEALEEALVRYGAPEIFNSDQGCQFTSTQFTQPLLQRNIRISMDSRGRFLDNIFIERLWRSVKYENIYLNAYETIPEARSGIEQYLEFYNTERLHQSLDYRTPQHVYSRTKEPVDLVDIAAAIPTTPQVDTTDNIY